MPHAAIAPELVREPRPSLAQHRRNAQREHRLSRRAALALEIERIGKDIEELAGDYQARLHPLTLAYVKAVKKLIQMER